GNCIADMHYWDLDPGAVRAMIADFLDAYRAHAAWDVPDDRLRWHCSVQLLRDAWYWHKRRQFEPAFREELGALLARAEQPPVGAEGFRARLARQHAEAERGQALRGGSCAAVPRRREDRRDRVAEQVLQATPAGLDVAPLLGRRACRPELLLAALGLVVGVVVAVLVQPEAPGGGVASAQLARERRVQRGRDDRDVEREPRAVEVVEQLEQALVAPPGVVVAEEEHD